MTGRPAEEQATDGRRLRWAQHRAERRARFVLAGVQAVDESGVDASAEQIAATAEVSRTVLYRYFRDRDDLRQAIAEQIVTAVVESVLPTLRIDAESTPREMIEPAIEVIVGWLDEHPNLYYFLRTRRADASIDVIETTLASQVAILLQGLMIMFGIDSDEAEPGAHGIVGLVEAIGAWWLTHRRVSREAITRSICDAVWRLLEGTARANGVHLDYDQRLPLGALTPVENP